MSLFGSGVQPGFHQSCVAALFKCGSFELLLVHVKAAATQPFLSPVLVVNNCVKIIHADKDLNCLCIVFCSGNLFSLGSSVFVF